LSELAELERKVKEFIDKVSSDFGVPAPKVQILPHEEMSKIYTETAGWYDSTEERLVLNADCISLGTVLHEYTHHLQFLRSGRDRSTAFPLRELSKLHCERSFEREAKGFALVYEGFYRDTWKKIVGVERGALPR